MSEVAAGILGRERRGNGAMRGDRHMGTNRKHNKLPRKRAASKGLTNKQRAVNLHAIGNRGTAFEERDNEPTKEHER